MAALLFFTNGRIVESAGFNARLPKRFIFAPNRYRDLSQKSRRCSPPTMMRSW
jgi:hypothetical protein